MYDANTISLHASHCSQCKKQSNPNETARHESPHIDILEDEEEQVEDHHQGRLLLCITCSTATHERCCESDQLIRRVNETTIGFQCSDCLNTNPTCNECNAAATQDESSLFRCSKCKRCFHFNCLPKFPDDHQQLKDVHSLPQRQAQARSICMQHQQCSLCIVFTAKPEGILAWRLSDTQQQQHTSNTRLKEVISKRKELLVKWMNKSYRHVSWLPEDWIMATNEILYETYVKDHANDFPFGHPIPKQWMMIRRILDVQDEHGNKVPAGSLNTISRVFAQFHGPGTEKGMLFLFVK